MEEPKDDAYLELSVVSQLTPSSFHTLACERDYNKRLHG